jgi:hypothetical protein
MKLHPSFDDPTLNCRNPYKADVFSRFNALLPPKIRNRDLLLAKWKEITR